MSKCVTHEGVVRAVKDGVLSVEVGRATACSSCSSRSRCTMGNGDTVMVDVPAGSGTFAPGDRVQVSLSSGVGRRAVVIAYVLPLLLLVVAVVSFVSFFRCSEIVSIIAAFAVLALYYLVIYILRHRLNHRMVVVVGQYVSGGSIR